MHFFIFVQKLNKEKFLERVVSEVVELRQIQLRGTLDHLVVVIELKKLAILQTKNFRGVALSAPILLEIDPRGVYEVP